jgi:hypothetical protein
MKNSLLLVALFFCGSTAQAQQCEGGLYLNPQVIRGEGTSQTESALKELVDFIRPTGLPVTPVINIRETQDVLTAVKKPAPPCWVYGNPVVGLASGYRPVAVNVDPIQSAVLILADIGTVKDGKPVELKTLPAADQAKVLAKLKTTSCFGIKSGVTTSLVKAENLLRNGGRNIASTRTGAELLADQGCVSLASGPVGRPDYPATERTGCHHEEPSRHR